MGWTPPRRPWCARVVVSVTTEQEASVSEVSTIGLDLAKHVFQAHGADASGKVVFRKRLRREKVLELFAGKPACLVAMRKSQSTRYGISFATPFLVSATQGAHKPWHFHAAR